MPGYAYKGRDKTGKSVKGTMNGSTESAVAVQLIHMGIAPSEIVLQGEEKQSFNLEDFFKRRKPKLQDLAFLCRQMYSLTRSGVPIVRAIRVVGGACKNEVLKEALMKVVNGIEEGRSLGTNLAEHRNIFPNLMIALVRMGESTGNLDQVFNQLSTHFEREIETRKRISLALRYPITVVVVITIAIAIVNLLVIPAFSNFFQQFKAELPLPTRILIQTSEFTLAYWPFILAGIGLSIFGISYYIKTPEGHFLWDKQKIQIPLVGSILLRTLLARFARSFALCIRSGVPLLESIDLIAKATDNLYVEDKISIMRRDIEHGEPLTSAAKNTQLFTPLVLQMLSVGEETGEVDRLLEEVAIYYEQEVDYDVKRLGDYFEPFILILLAAMVLVLALGVYLPMWDISKAAFGK